MEIGFFRCISSVLKLTPALKSYKFYSNMPKTALLLLAEGAEEMEAIISADVLRRGGVLVTIAGVTGTSPVKCSRDVVILPDTSMEEAAKQGLYDAVILPGGLKGANTLAGDPKVGEILKAHEQAGKLVSAICAGPTALKAHGIGEGKRVTSYPSVKPEMENGSKYQYKEDRVVVDGSLITSRGPGTAFEFALSLLEYLEGKEKSESVKTPMLVN